MPIVVALLLLAAPAGDTIERIAPQIAAERAAKCGLGPVITRYDELLEFHILTIAGATDATDDQLSCIDRAASHHMVEMPPAVQARYQAIREARLAVKFIAEARRDLPAKDLLRRLPTYVEGVTDVAVFTRQIETLCGRRAKGAFDPRAGYHALNPNWMGKLKGPSDNKVFNCIIHAAAAAGFKLGFVGNEALTTD